MTDILNRVIRILLSGSEPQLPSVSPPAAAAAAAGGSTLLLGERSISRSLLLLAAVAAASEMGLKVMFFAQTQIQSLPVFLQKYAPNLTPESLKKIKFCYPRTMGELLQQVASLHESTKTSHTPPSLIIIDRLEGFLCGPREGSHNRFHVGVQSCTSHLSALLCDTAAFFTGILEQRAPSSAPCRIIASFQSEVDIAQPSTTDSILDVLVRYFEVQCTLEKDRSYEAVAAGPQEVWHIYLSRTGITQASWTKDPEDMPDVAVWRLFIFSDGLMEFKLV